MTTYPERVRVDVPIPEILRNLVDSVDGFGTGDDGAPIDWDYWERLKADEAFAQNLDVSILEHGILHPIGILLRTDGYWTQHNGHHRLLMAIWLCLDSVPVVFIPEDDIYLSENASIELFDMTGGMFDMTGGM
jgi:hypothetical protein